MSILKTTTNQDLTKDSTFQEMLNVLNSLPVNPRPGATGNAQPSQVLSGITFSNVDNIDLVGTMPNQGACISNLTSQGAQYTIPQGYHDGNGKVSVNLPVKTAINSTVSTQNQSIAIPAGYYSTDGSVRANISNLIASVIKKGEVVGGVTGTYTEGMKMAKLDITTAPITGNTYTINNLTFKPKVVLFAYRGGVDISCNCLRIATTEFSFTQNYGYDSVEYYGVGGYPNYRPFTSWGGQDFGTGTKSITITNSGFTVNSIIVNQNKSILVEWVAFG